MNRNKNYTSITTTTTTSETDAACYLYTTKINTGYPS